MRWWVGEKSERDGAGGWGCGLRGRVDVGVIWMSVGGGSFPEVVQRETDQILSSFTKLVAASKVNGGLVNSLEALEIETQASKVALAAETLLVAVGEEKSRLLAEDSEAERAAGERLEEVDRALADEFRALVAGLSEALGAVTALVSEAVAA